LHGRGDAVQFKHALLKKVQVDETRVDQGGGEREVLFTHGYELRDHEVMLLQAPRTCGRRVVSREVDEALLPTIGQLRGGEVDPLRVVGVRLMELGELADGAVDFVGLLGPRAFIEKRQVGFDGQPRDLRQFVL
jgi:hypothetical protein